MHDEEAIFAEEVEQAQGAGTVRSEGLDWFSFIVSFKGVFLEGVEVVFIVITFGLSADNMPVAISSAAVGCLLVMVVGTLIRHPLSKVPENTLKYGVGLLLASFGTFWAVEGLGILREGRHSLEWPGADLSIIALVLAWFALSRILVSTLRKPRPKVATPASENVR